VLSLVYCDQDRFIPLNQAFDALERVVDSEVTARMKAGELLEGISSGAV
jgi:hypothetical protein